MRQTGIPHIVSGRWFALVGFCCVLGMATGACVKTTQPGDETPDPNGDHSTDPSDNDDTSTNGTVGADDSDRDQPVTAGLPCISCHSAPMGQRRAVVTASGAGGHVISGDSLTNDHCVLCHDVTQHLQGKVRLHEDPGSPGSSIVLESSPSTNPVEADKLTAFCTVCHSPSEYVVHGGDGGPSCTLCHNLHDPASANLTLVASLVKNQVLGEDRAVVFTARTGAGSFDDGKPGANDGICQVCHTQTQFHRHDGSSTPHFDATDCTACHPHAGGFIAQSSDALSCVSCHSTAQGDRRAIVDSSGAGGHHLDGDALTDADCETCHEMTEHMLGHVRLWEDPDERSTVISLAGDPSTLPAEGQKLEPFCAACHSASNHQSHQTGGAWKPTCTECHNLHDPSTENLDLVAATIRNRTLDDDRSVVFTSRSGTGSFSDSVGDQDGVCQVCHTQTAYHRYDGSGASHENGRNCTTCHEHDRGFRAPSFGTNHTMGLSCAVCHVGGGGGSLRCVGCHLSPQGSRQAVVNSLGDGNHHLFGNGLDSDECEQCHDQSQHKQGTVRLWDDPADEASNDPATAIEVAGNASELTGFCVSCHGGVDHPTIHTTGGAWEPVCTECHELHDPLNQNLALVANVVHNVTLGVDKPVVFTAQSGPNSYDDGDPSALDGICMVCHTDTNYHAHDGSGSGHFDGQDCSDCHPHENSFLPSGVGDCTGCHAAQQGIRRPVVGEFPVGDTHAHYGAQLNSDACLVCHSVDTHMNGYVDLIDADDSSLYSFQQPSDLVSDPDLSDFCASCHDADGATRMISPLNPFGNGNAPPDVAVRFKGTLQWYEEYGDVCLGTEGTLRGVNSHHDISDADQAFSGAKIECLNCHGAHNVSASQPLADPFDTRTVWTGDSTAFCLSCHGGGFGPLDPALPAGVISPVLDVAGLHARGVELLDACTNGTGDCSSLRGVDSCDYTGEPWYVEYAWQNTAHGPNSKRGWNTYSGAPAATLDCMVCHDPHGSYTATNTPGNPYMIRDFVDGTAYVDDGYQASSNWTGPPWDTFGTARAVQVAVDGMNVDWGNGLCSVCHADWLAAQDFHDTCTSCQTCHAHGAFWSENDWAEGDDDAPCPGTAR